MCSVVPIDYTNVDVDVDVEVDDVEVVVAFVFRFVCFVSFRLLLIM